jgi:hypothetical protein
VTSELIKKLRIPHITILMKVTMVTIVTPVNKATWELPTYTGV